MRYQDLIDRIDGYTIGTLIVDDVVGLQSETGDILTLRDDNSIEVLNGGHFEIISVKQARIMSELVAGLYARVRL